MSHEQMAGLDSLPVVNPYSSGFDQSHQAFEDAFPVIDPEFEPFGPKVLIQVRRVLTRTKSGIFLGEADKTTEAWNTVVGKLIAVGPLAFKNRATAQPWPEGMWAQIGDMVRFPRHTGDRLSVKLNDDRGDPVVILLLDDHQITGRYTGNPMDIRAFIE